MPTGMVQRVADRWLWARRVTPSVVGVDHFLVEEPAGGSRRFFVVKLEESGGKPILAILARLYVHYNPKCDAYEVLTASAVGGYGPLLYDATMEAIYPKWLTPDRSVVTGAAARVWQHYMDRRSDVEHVENPETCPDHEDRTWLDYLYRKRGGRLGQSVMTGSELGAHPAVVAHLGAPKKIESVSMDLWDFTPNV